MRSFSTVSWRWKIEVKFRGIKTTMKLEMLRVKSPEMARKTMRMVRGCYNLVKDLQREAKSRTAPTIAPPLKTVPFRTDPSVRLLPRLRYTEKFHKS